MRRKEHTYYEHTGICGGHYVGYAFTCVICDRQPVQYKEIFRQKQLLESRMPFSLIFTPRQTAIRGRRYAFVPTVLQLVYL